MIEPRHVVVVGGGVAGLVAALDCARVGIRVTVIERAETFGGAVATETVAGIRVDVGAESYATRSGTVRSLIDGLGLSDSVVTPAAAGAWVRLADGRSAPLPKAGLLGIPSNPLAADVRQVIGWRGAIRAYVDRIRPVLTIGRENNLGDLVERRMGRAVLESLVAPVTRGVYSADPRDLDVARAAPGLNRALTVSGSLSGAVSLLRADAPAGSAVEGLRGGMSTLVDALVTELRERGAELVLGVSVTALERVIGTAGTGMSLDAETSTAPAAHDPDAAAPSWRLTLDDDRHDDNQQDNDHHVDADFVIIATPEAQAITLLAPFSTEIAAAEPAETPTVELVTLVLDAAVLDAAPRGTGVLVAESAQQSVTAKALTHSTAKWSWLREEASAQHPHRHVIRLSYGRQGVENPIVGRPDTDVLPLALSDATEILGVPLDDAALVDFTRTTWHSTLPRAAIGQRERAETLRAAAIEIGELDVTGAWLAGTGLASVIPDALAASARIRHLVATSYLESGVFGDAHTRTGIDKTTPDERAE